MVGMTETRITEHLGKGNAVARNDWKSISWMTGEQKGGFAQKKEQTELLVKEAEEFRKDDSLSSTEKGKEFIFPVVPETRQKVVSFPSQQEKKGQRILRVHFVRQILRDLGRARSVAGSPSVTVYVNSIFKTIRAARDINRNDPFLQLLLALYDALIHDNRWADYTAEQFDRAYRLLKGMAKRQQVSIQAIDKAILKLDEAGFDTTPYSLSAGEKE